MAFIELSRSAQVSIVGSTNTAADLVGDVIDMLNFESVMFVGHKSASNSSSWLFMECGTASATSTFSQTTGDVPLTKTTIYMDVQRPIKRYVRGVLKGATTTGKYAMLETIVYNSKDRPVTQPASTTGARVYSAGSGTATG